MKKIDSKIESLCDKLEYIVKYGNELIVNKRSDYWGYIYTVSSNDLCDDIFTILFIISKDAYSIKVNNKDSEVLEILIDKDNENAKNLMDLVIDKYKNRFSFAIPEILYSIGMRNEIFVTEAGYKYITIRYPNPIEIR